MKFSNVPWAAVTLAASLSAGCMTVNGDKFDRKLAEWVPIGTSSDLALRTMRGHGFDCNVERNSSANPSKDPALVCWKNNRFMNRTWLVILRLKDGRVARYDRVFSSDFLRLAPSNP